MTLQRQGVVHNLPTIQLDGEIYYLIPHLHRWFKESDFSTSVHYPGDSSDPVAVMLCGVQYDDCTPVLYTYKSYEITCESCKRQFMQRQNTMHSTRTMSVPEDWADLIYWLIQSHLKYPTVMLMDLLFSAKVSNSNMPILSTNAVVEKLQSFANGVVDDFHRS